jgi:hypothetical protein
MYVLSACTWPTTSRRYQRATLAAPPTATSPPKSGWRMMIKYIDFESSRAALAHAQAGYASGAFDLFRGQPRCWPMRSTLCRLPDRAAQEAAMQRTNAFIVWAKAEPLLGQRINDTDDALAIAQHYGLPTPFIDITTDPRVAQFFALDQCAAGDDAIHGSRACIIAMQEKNMQDFFRQRWTPTYDAPGPETVRVAVGNLWRLEAQAGLFLADHELIDLYEFTYLTFPVLDDDAPEYSRDRIYPEERSDLELTVDQYLYHEFATDASARLSAMLKDVAPNLLRSAEGDIGLNGVTAPPPLGSWSSATSTRMDHSRYSQARRAHNHRLDLELPVGVEVAEWATEMATQKPDDNLLTSLRQRSAIIHVGHAENPRTSLGAVLERQWDAIREEPYSNDQAWDSVLCTALLFALRNGAVGVDESTSADVPTNGLAEAPREAYVAYGGDLLVEFATTVGYNRALVNSRRLADCLRSDIDDYVPETIYTNCANLRDRMAQLLIAIRRPALVFEFEPFADLYVKQVVPYSALFRPNFPLFSVLRLNRFGRP